MHIIDNTHTETLDNFKIGAISYLVSPWLFRIFCFDCRVYGTRKDQLEQKAMFHQQPRLLSLGEASKVKFGKMWEKVNSF